MNEEDEEESRERIADLDPMDVAILVQRKVGGLNIIVSSTSLQRARYKESLH